MRKKLLEFVVLTLCLFLLTVPAFAVDTAFDFAGSGTEADPYLLSSAADLAELANIVNGGENGTGLYFALTNDVQNVSTVIGSGSNHFNGNIDGCGYTVTLSINRPEDSYIGFLGYLDAEGTIQNITIAGSVVGRDNIGGVCGCLNYGKIINCCNEAFVSCPGSGSSFVGGVCGLNDFGTIDACSNLGEVTGSGYSNVNSLGGICGYNYSGLIMNCYNSGVLHGGFAVGGVCGTVSQISSGTLPGGTIINCYNNGNIGVNDDSIDVGGICGQVLIEGFVFNCYSSGSVQGYSWLGGVCGYNVGCTFENCYYDSDVYPGQSVGLGGDFVGGLPTALCQAVPGVDGALVDLLNSYEKEELSLNEWTVLSGGYPSFKTADPDPTPDPEHKRGKGRAAITYIVNVEQTANGTITANTIEAVRNRSVIVSINPDDGYMLSKLTVTDKDGKQLKLDRLGNGNYKFTMPTSDVIVRGEFAAIR